MPAHFASVFPRHRENRAVPTTDPLFPASLTPSLPCSVTVQLPKLHGPVNSRRARLSAGPRELGGRTSGMTSRGGGSSLGASSSESRCQESMSLKYEPASEPLHISVK